MKAGKFSVLILATISMVSMSSEAVDDLKTYYEKQKAALIWSFVPPQLGSQVTITLTAGSSRTGILMQLKADSLSLLMDSGNATYQRLALREASRTLFFAEDFAHVTALELTRAYKDDLRKENNAEEAANTHEANVSISAKLEKSSNKAIEAKERENKQTGEKQEDITTTRTATEVLTLSITVQNITTHPDTYVVEYYFFAKPISKGVTKTLKKGEVAPVENKDVKLKAKSSKRITVRARSRESFRISSDPFDVNKVTMTYNGYLSTREPRQIGEECAGYVVILKYGSTVLDIKASSKSYLNEVWLRKFR